MAETVPTPALAVGSVVTFTGYSQLDEGIEPILTPGQLVRIESINEVEGSMVVVPLDNSTGDTVFAEEIKADAAASGAITPMNKAVVVEAVGKAVSLAAAKAKSAKTRKPKVVKVKATKVKAKAKAVKVKAKAKAKAKAVKGKAIKAVRATKTIAVESEKLPIPISDSNRVSEILAGNDALAAAKALAAQAEETYFTLGGVLWHIHYEKIYTRLGYEDSRDGFERYTESELGVQYRKAMYLIDIYGKFRSIGIDEHRLTQIGWSKAKELTNYVTADNFDELVGAAQAKSREELVSYLRESFVGAESRRGGNIRSVKIKFALFADQAETVTRALDAAKEKLNTDDLSQALEFICAEWASLADGIEIPLEDALRHLGAKYGVTVAVVDPTSVGGDATSSQEMQSAGH